MLRCFVAAVAAVVLISLTGRITAAEDDCGTGVVTVSAEPSPGEKPVTVVHTFTGDSAIGPKANPDNVGAVGANEVVDFTCANFVVHDKRSGKVLLTKPQKQFWADLGFEDLHPNDPRILYDPLSKRYVATIADDRLHHLYLAVSTTGDAAKPWKGVQTPFDSPDFGFRMGLDKNGLYGCWWNRNSDIHIMMNCCAIAREDLLAANGPDMKNVQIFTNLEIESFPATDLNPNKAPGDAEMLLCHEFAGTGTFSKLYLYKITWTGKIATISKAQELPLRTTYFAPNGGSHQNEGVQPAPGLRLRADEGRRTSCVFAYKGSLFTCNSAKRSLDSRCGIFWCEVRERDGAVLQEALLDAPDADYLAPSLAVDGKGNVGIGCTRSSSDEYPSACVMAHRAGTAANSIGKPVVSVKGTAAFTLSVPKAATPWGNYNSTCVDPVDPTIIWTYQEYGASGVPDKFSTCWTAFRIGN